jgi:hypothetical protein
LPARLKLPNGSSVKVPADQARVLQESAAEANEKFGKP